MYTKNDEIIFQDLNCSMIGMKQKRKEKLDPTSSDDILKDENYMKIRSLNGQP